MKKLTAILTALTMISGLAFTVSADESYAVGDVDMDGYITGHDAAMVSRCLLEEDYTLTEQQLKLADVNADGEVTQTDADMIYNAQEYRLGDTDWSSDVVYPVISDASKIITYYRSVCMGLTYDEMTDVQKNLADMDLDGNVDMKDALLVMDLFARTSNNMEDTNASNGIYYYSADSDSPAYIGHSVFDPGDVDMDGARTGHDAAMISRYLLDDSYTLTDEQLKLADTNSDGEVTQADAELAVRKSSVPEVGKVVWNNGRTLRDLNDASAILECYAYNAAGMKYDNFNEAQMNNSDMDADGDIDLDDAKISLTLIAFRGAGMTIHNEENNIYYYSLDPASPAYIESTAVID